MLETKGLSIFVPGRCLVAGLDVTLRAGENWAVLGANGSGKSLLLATLAGLRPAKGSVWLEGQAIDRFSARVRARRIALLAQESHRAFGSTVLESVLAGRFAHLDAWRWETEEDMRIAHDALESVGLRDFAMRPVAGLSGGEWRRCAIATVLAQGAPVCLWDEPTDHLDLRHQGEVLALLSARAGTQGLNVFVLHDLNLAAHYCSHALLLYGDGRFRAGPVAEILVPDFLSDLYGCAIRQAQLPERFFYLSQ